MCLLHGVGVDLLGRGRERESRGENTEEGGVKSVPCGLHVEMNRGKGEPRVTLQEHSIGLGGWALHQQMD